MAEIRPFRAWRYSRSYSKNIDSLTSPLFDVISKKQREKLYQNPYNSIHISVPKGSDPATAAAETLQRWKDEGVLVQDPIPSIYVYYQFFSFPGSKKTRCRKGFICYIKAYDWDEHILLRHENTIPHAVNDRTELLEKTELNVSPTHGLYTDEHHELEAYMDESMRNPIYETEDYQGVRDVLSVIQDAEVIEKFKNLIASKQIILADGHHRYESAIEYRKACMENNSHHTGEEAYNYHMIYLTNTESDDLVILPTHRLISRLESFDKEGILASIEEHFNVKEVDNPYDIHEIIMGKPWTFGLVFKDNAYAIRLKSELFPKLNWPFPEVVKQLDLTVMHYFIIEKALGIPGPQQRRSKAIGFERNFSECLNKVYHKEAQLAIITQEISMEEVKNVCFSGHTMPQKSTYFYPKAVCGLVFGSIKTSEQNI